MPATPRSWWAAGARPVATARSIAAVRLASASRVCRRRPIPANAPCARSSLRSLAGRGPGHRRRRRQRPEAAGRGAGRPASRHPAVGSRLGRRRYRRPRACRRRRRRGLRYLTDDRLGEGTVGPFSVATNLVLKEIGERALLAARARATADLIACACPRADPAPRHPHALGEDADRPALRRQHPEGAAGARARVPTPAS